MKDVWREGGDGVGVLCIPRPRITNDQKHGTLLPCIWLPTPHPSKVARDVQSTTVFIQPPKQTDPVVSDELYHRLRSAVRESVSFTVV